MQILIVEDEKRLAEALKQILVEQKYMADVVYDGNDGLDYGMSGIYDLIILDIMIPYRDGFEVARELRRNKIETPILMLTAKALAWRLCRDTPSRGYCRALRWISTPSHANTPTSK